MKLTDEEIQERDAVEAARRAEYAQRQHNSIVRAAKKMYERGYTQTSLKRIYSESILKEVFGENA